MTRSKRHDLRRFELFGGAKNKHLDYYLVFNLLFSLRRDRGGGEGVGERRRFVSRG